MFLEPPSFKSVSPLKSLYKLKFSDMKRKENEVTKMPNTASYLLLIITLVLKYTFYNYILYKNIKHKYVQFFVCLCFAIKLNQQNILGRRHW